MKRSSMRPIHGFTLVELTVTLAIAAILIGGVTLSLRQISQKSRLNQVVDELIFLDQLTRQTAQRTNQSLGLTFHLDQQIVWQNRPTNQNAIDFQFPASVRLKAIKQDATPTATPFSVNVTPEGYTQTYALLLTSDQTDNDYWLLFSGLTGHSALYPATSPYTPPEPIKTLFANTPF